MGRSGPRTLALLRDIASNPACQSTRGLLILRPRIRKVLAHPAPVLLCLIVDTTRETRVLRIALWMLGRVGDAYATTSVVCCANHDSFRVRREAVRSLHRLHAWAQLRRISRDHPDPRIRILAQVAAPSSYTDRLARYVASSKTVETTEGLHPLVIAPQVDIDQGRPPKSGRRIASVLRRIHRLVQRARRKRKLPAAWTRVLRQRFR
jgi:hypothetical protein